MLARLVGRLSPAGPDGILAPDMGGAMHEQTHTLPSVGDGVFSLLQRAVELGQLRSRQAVLELIEMMDHPSPLVRSEAARELARVGRTLRQQGRLMAQVGQPRSGILTAQGVIDDCMARASARSEDWREAWAESLGQWQHEGALPALTTLLGDCSPRVRAAAAQALGETQDMSALAPLRAAAADADDRVRCSVAYAVGTIGLGEGLDVLDTLRNDPVLLVRCAMLQALGNLPGAKTLDWLHAALHDHTPEVRWQSIRSLAKVGRVASLPHLERLFDDTTPVCGETVGQAALEAAALIREREGHLWSQVWQSLYELQLKLKRRIHRRSRRLKRFGLF